MMKAQDKVSIDDRLFLVTFKHAKESHLHILDKQVCVKCEGQWCTHMCPAQVYNWNEKKKEIIISWENCLETAACLTGCPFENITFDYPKGGKGVEFRYG